MFVGATNLNFIGNHVGSFYDSQELGQSIEVINLLIIITSMGQPSNVSAVWIIILGVGLNKNTSRSNLKSAKMQVHHSNFKQERVSSTT